MFIVYTLKSLKNGKRYVGYTAKSEFKRLHEHNSGCNKWTKVNRPFNIVYTEKYENKNEAIKREKVFKIRSRKKIS